MPRLDVVHVPYILQPPSAMRLGSAPLVSEGVAFEAVHKKSAMAGHEITPREPRRIQERRILMVIDETREW